MNHKRWTKILTLYLEFYNLEMMETKPVPQPKFMPWLEEEFKAAAEVVGQLNRLGINPLESQRS